MFSELQQILWPAKCVTCDRVLSHEVAFCERCSESVEPVPPERCLTCAEPGLFEFGRCLRCLRRPSPLRSAVAAFTHAGSISRAIHRFKYEDHPELARPLVQLWCEELGSRLPRAQTIVPLPLHRSRFRTRRYDQSHLLARELARVTGRALIPALTRTRATERQVGLNERERDRNVSHAFEADSRIEARTVLLVDDVLTTGATARAAADALLDAGARDVHLVTIARAYSL